MNEAFVVIDLEATDREPATAHIVEWAAIMITPPWFGAGGMEERGALVRPPVPIPAETSAVHHILDADVRFAQPWAEQRDELAHLLVPAGRIAVAHNAAFEQALLGNEGLHLGREVSWLCTYKAACRVWPDAPGHSNEVLRYYLGLGTGRTAFQAPHSAMHDARVTAQLLAKLLEAGTSIEDMLKWSTEPALLPTCPLGDWRGAKWSDVEEGFLFWIVRKIQDRPDVVFCARTELERRAADRAALAKRHAGETVDDGIPF